MCEDMELYFIEDDPGVPPGRITDPFAGLDEGTAVALGRLLPPRDGIDIAEGKAIGGAQMAANVGARDVALRQRYAGTLHGTTEQRRIMRLAAKNAMRALKPRIAETARLLARLMDRWTGGHITTGRMRNESATALRKAYEEARQVGRRASGLARMKSAGVPDRVQREEERWFRDAVREELGYWHRFLDEIRRGEVTERRLGERLEDYVRSIRFMFEAARVQAMPDNVLLHWVGPKKTDPNICEGCQLMMEWTPFTKETIPAVPRDGSTPCLSNCRHRIVVRVARNYNDVIRRKNQLDRMVVETRGRPSSSSPRAKMVRKLQEVKDEAHGGRRRGKKLKGRAGNPFKGERLPAVPRYSGRVGMMRMQEAEESTAGIIWQIERVTGAAVVPEGFSDTPKQREVLQAILDVAVGLKRSCPLWRHVNFKYLRLVNRSWVSGGVVGRYYHTYPGGMVEVACRRDARAVANTFVHEIGHNIEYMLTPDGRKRGEGFAERFVAMYATGNWAPPPD